MHTEKPIFTAQFHPEAFGGPTDTEVTIIWLRYLSQQIKSDKTDMFFYFELWVPVSPQFLFDTFMDLVKGKKTSVTHAMSRPVKVPPPPKVRHLSHDSNPSYIPTALDQSLYPPCWYRVVTKISSWRVNISSRWGIKQLSISFGSIFLLFSYESSWGPHS